MKNRGKAFIWVFLVFLVGAVFGGTLTFWGVQPGFSAAGDSTTPPRQTRAQRNERFVNRMAELLELEEVQKTQMGQILEASRNLYEEADQVRKEHKKGIRTKTRHEIRGILRPDQTERFNQYLEERDLYWRERRARQSGAGC